MKKEVIIALDFPTLEKTLEFLDKFKEEKLFVKVGMELYLQNGPVVIDEIKKRGHKIFLDLKLHDIPNTVYSAAKGLAKFNIDIFKQRFFPDAQSDIVCTNHIFYSLFII